MKILGRPIAEKILVKLKSDIQNAGLRPRLAIISAGYNPISATYIALKKEAAQQIGIDIREYTLQNTDQQRCLKVIYDLNEDQDIHGIILQLPLPSGWNREKFITAIQDNKDVDGFKDTSLFVGATALGVWEMLTAFGKHEGFDSVFSFLQNKKIVVVGKGATAGKPTISLLKSKGLHVHVVDSKTQDPDLILKSADVIISASGKKYLVHKDNIKKGAYIIGVGVGREIYGSDEKVFGDVHPNVKSQAKLYCPTIGGIGPLTVACLLRNVFDACRKA